MASIQNNGVWPVQLPGLTILRNKTAMVTNADLDAIDMARALPAMIATGDVTVTRDADKTAAPGAPEPMPARHAEAGKPAPSVDVAEVSPAREAMDEPEKLPEAAPEPIPETPAIVAAPSKKGA